MRKVVALLGGALVAILLLSAACGGGGDSSSATPSATATPAGSAGATPTAAELSADLGTLRDVMHNTIANAQAANVQGARSAVGGAEKPMEAIVKAVRAKDPTLADKMEALELDYEVQIDSANPDLTTVALDAQKVLDLLGQVETALSITAGTPATSAELATDLATLKTVMNNTIAKADAGDLQGTRDAVGGGDTAIEAIIKAVRVKDATLADQIVTLERDYEDQADSDNPDLTVISQDAQQVLHLLPQVAITLNITY
jgi:DNA-binding transcriptional regulator YbjK